MKTNLQILRKVWEISNNLLINISNYLNTIRNQLFLIDKIRKKQRKFTGMNQSEGDFNWLTKILIKKNFEKRFRKKKMKFRFG